MPFCKDGHLFHYPIAGGILSRHSPPHEQGLRKPDPGSEHYQSKPLIRRPNKKYLLAIIRADQAKEPKIGRAHGPEQPRGFVRNIAGIDIGRMDGDTSPPTGCSPSHFHSTTNSRRLLIVAARGFCGTLDADWRRNTSCHHGAFGQLSRPCQKHGDFRQRWTDLRDAKGDGFIPGFHERAIYLMDSVHCMDREPTDRGSRSRLNPSSTNEVYSAVHGCIPSVLGSIWTNRRNSPCLDGPHGFHIRRRRAWLQSCRATG